MKQWNVRYEGEKRLEAFVEKEGLKEASSLLVQIMSGVNRAEPLRRLHAHLKKLLPKAVISGMGSALQLADDALQEDEIVLVFTLFEKSRIEEWSMVFPDDGNFDAEAVAESLAQKIGKETKGILLYTNAVNADVESLVIAYQKRINVPVFGGLASSFDSSDPSPMIFTTERILWDDAITAVFLSGEDLLLTTDTLLAWETIGREFTVTRADGKKLYELDGMSIKEVYEKYFGEMTREKLLYLSLAHPLVRQSEEFGEMTRVLLEYEGEYGIYTGKFEEGEKVQIGFGNYKQMVDSMEKSWQLFSQWPTEAYWAFICISYTRGYVDLLRKSVAPYRKNLSKILVAITFGEFGLVKNQNAFLNNTIVKVYLSEDPEARFAVEPVEVELDEKDRLLETFSTLVTSSSREIIELNHYLEEEVKKRTKELADLNASLEKRIRQEVQKNREKDKMLYHQSKLASMGEMINNIAHQWRQPLNIIALVMQDLTLKAKMGMLSPESVVLAEKKINETLKYLSDTIDDFRSFAARSEEQPHPDRFEVCKTVREAIRLVSVVLEDVDIRLELELPDKECVVTGRANDLKQVVLNLVYNAIDVFKERHVEKPVIRIGVRQNSHVVVYVHDNGGGIEEGLLDKIFEPYFTTKYQARGTGLGLYMSRMIVEKRLGGRILAKNRQGGALFEIALPIVAH
ncbi:FIST N-terminal domain-containing protein [Hydrogenimonas sp.]